MYIIGEESGAKSIYTKDLNSQHQNARYIT
jgi:hypothetical protein